ncbi:DUF11 domain-containing protein [Lewinella sp. W8]|nr:DUF11 domain-containing protein [Lewinella sp. W8]
MENQGEVTADNIEVTDYLPTGLSLSANATGWTDNGDGTATFAIDGELAPGASTTITILVTVDAGTDGEDLVNVAEISAATDSEDGAVEDIDSTPDTDDGNDAGGAVGTPSDDATTGDGSGAPGDVEENTDEDDADPALISIGEFDLALIKTLSPGQELMVMPGDEVSFTITVENQGEVTADNIEVTDYIPTGLSFSANNDGAIWTDNGDGTATASIAGELAPGESTTLTILLTVDAGTDGEELINVAEISAATDSEDGAVEDIDSTPDTDAGNDAGGAVGTPSDDVTSGDGTGAPGDTDPNTDEDDADPALIRVNPFDLALIKELADGQSGVVMPGEEVTFTITVFNQGMVDAANIEITDYVPDGFTFDENQADNDAAGWSASGDNAVITLDGVLAAGESTTVDIVLTVDGGLTANTQLVNVAEISDATDSEGGAVEDIDSTPDDDANNDAGGQVNSGADDVNDGNGTGAVGDSDPVSDEDDADPEDVVVAPFDLALTKVVTDPADGMVMPGDEVTFTITVENQGMVTATDIEITDYVPNGLSFDENQADNDAAGWSADGDNAVITLAGPLEPGESTTVDIVLTVDAGTDNEELINVAEISAANDGTGTPATDLDSPMDDDPDNDAGGAAGTPSDDVTSGDGTGAPGDTDANTDEDNADPALIRVNPFDLALIKELADGQSQVVMPGDEVTFTITVFNQGMVDAANIEITDYVPDGFTFDENQADNDAAGWSASGDNAVITLDGVLAAGESTTVDIVLTVDGGLSANTQLVNVAEISDATDSEGGAVEDIDSTPDDDANNDAGGQVNSGADDVNDGNGTGAVGDSDPVSDEDDADPEDVVVAPFDLALTKVVTNPADGMVMPGDEVTFTITVENQGMVTATDIEITDYVPNGLSFDENQADNDAAGWSADGDNAVITLAGPLEPGETTTVDIVLTVDPGTDGEELVNVAEISASNDGTGTPIEDFDSDMDDDPNNDAGGEPETPSDDATTGDGSGEPGDTEENTDEDDADPALIRVNTFDLALIKTLSDGQDPVVEPGDEVSFTITVENQGMVDAANIEVTDYIPDGLSFSANNDAALWTDNGDGTATASLPGILVAGESTTITILLTVDPGTDGEDLVNVAEISAATDSEGGAVEDVDSTPDTDDTNDAGGAVGTPSDDASTGDGSGEPGDTEENTDEDDADPALISIGEFDLALVKTLSDGQEAVVMPGDEVSFTITVENQGMVTAANIEVTDYIPTGLSFSANNDLSIWTDNGDGTATAVVPGTLAPGGSTTLTILLTVDPGTDGEDLVNVAEISDATDSVDGEVEDIDSTPDTDDTNDAGGAVGTPSDDATTGDGSGEPGDTEENTDEDDADPALISIGAFDLALIKELGEGEDGIVEPGDEVTFTITVFNQGMVDAANIEITDYVPDGFTFDENQADNAAAGWSASGDNAVITLDGVLAAGASTTIDIVLTVDGGVQSNTQLINVAEISDATDSEGGEVEDIDSTPDDDATNDAGGQVNSAADDVNDGNGTGTVGDSDPVSDEDDADPEDVVVAPFDLALIKELADGQSATVEPGDTIRYTITVINQGGMTANNIEVTDYIPENMTFEMGAGDGVTDNATLGWTASNGLATNTLVIDGGLPPNESITIDLFLTLDSPLLPPGTVIDNFAEISGATDITGADQGDIDSEYDQDPDDDDLTADNEVNGNGNIPGEDDDDHDIASITIEGFDLALIKVLADDQPAEVRPGDTIHYRIRVINQGMIAADNIELVDYLPADGSLYYEGGIMGNDDAGWSLNGDGNPMRTLSVANGGLPDPLEPSEEIEVSIFLTLDNPLPAGATVDNFAEIAGATDENGDPQNDIDSTPDEDNDDTLNDDNDVSGNGNQGEDEDDHDIATVEILPFDLALIKELADGQSAVVAPGDTVAYTITVFNQGDIPADNIVISDYIPANMTFEAGAGNGVTDNATIGWTESNGIATTTLTIDGGLQPDESVTVDIYLTLNNPLEAGIDVANFAEISDATDENGDEQDDDDSEFDDNPDDDDLTDDNETGGDGDIPGEDDDDHDVAVITTATFDLALIKELGPDQDMAVEPGDTIEYVITILNQGDIAADNIEVTDYLPENMFFEGGIDGNEDWTDNGGLITRTIEVGDELDAPLAPQASVQVSLFLTIDNPLPAGTVIDNFAEISDATDDTGDAQEDVDSEYDQDPDDDTLTQDNEVNGNGDNPGEDDDDHDVATVVIEAFDLALIKELAEGQSVNVEAGDTVYFTINILNQGMIAADNILVSDYVTNQVDGFMWDPTIPVNDAAGWMQTGTIGPDTLLVQTTLSVENGALPEGGLAPGETVSVDIALVVNPAMEAVMQLTNLAEISDATDENGDEVEDVDSPMDEDPYNDEFFEDNEIQGDGLAGEDEDNHDPASIFVGGFDLALQKGLADGEPNVVETGEEITFTITVFNQGAIPADNIALVDYIPDGFLFDPELNPNWTDNGDGTASDTLSVAEGTLPEGGLLPGQSTTVTITLTVAPPMFPDYALGEVGPDDVNPDGVESGQVLVNQAEIVSATDDEGESHDDIDSTPDNDSDNDDEDGNEVDDEINGDGQNGEDEDDSDIAIVTVECYQDPGVDNTITVCLGCDEATVVINLFESLAGRPNIGGTFSEGVLTFMDEDGNPITIVDVDGNELGSDDFDPENVIIPGTLDRSMDYTIDYTIAAVNDCPEMVATITIDIFDIQNLSCTGFQNISLGEDCQAEITPDMIMEGFLTCANSLEVVLLTTSGDTLRDEMGNPTTIVTNDQVNQTLFVSLVDPQCDNSCWGQILIEDKKRPEIDCADDADGFGDKDFICTDIDQIFQEQVLIFEADDMPDFLNFTGIPVVEDNCTPYEDLVIQLSDLLIPNSDPQCREQTILRTFTVTDASGNSASCVQQITVRPPTLDDVTIPTEETLNFSCSDSFETLPNGNPVPSLGGEPFVMTALGMYDVPGNGSYCNIALSYEDGPRVQTCPNSFKFVRTYRVFDWCDPDADPIIYTQTIKVGDTEAPSFTGPTQDNDFDGVIDEGPLVFSTNSGEDCGAYIRLDDPSIQLTDNCSATIQLKADIYPGGDLDGAPIGTFFLNLDDENPEISTLIPAGAHIIRYSYTDVCGNAGFTDVDFIVEDRTEPIAICEDALNVSLTSANESGGPSEGFARLVPEDIDAGSYDDCGDVTLQIGRVRQLENGTYELLPGAVYGEEVILTCADIGTVLIGLRVEDGSGNVNFCWLDVLVEDKIAPTCIAPADINMSCIDYNAELPADLSEATSEELDAAFGAATLVDNCGGTIEQTISGDVNSCGVGQFTRTFTATDGEGLTNTAPCVQRIRVIGLFDYTITFPLDEEGDCADVPEYNGIEFDDYACDLITINTSVDTFRTQETASDECFKLEVTYDIINWCEYNSIGQAYLIPRDREGDRDPASELMYLHVRPGADEGTTSDDIAWLSKFSDREYNAGAPQNDILLDNGDDLDGDDDDNGDDNIDSNPYAQDDSRGFFRYVQFIKIYDEVEPVILADDVAECFAGTGDNCVADVTLDFVAFDECSDISVTVELDADYAGVATEFERSRFLTDAEFSLSGDSLYTVSLSGIPVGDHALRVNAADGCGNFDVQVIAFCVTADKAPTPICVQTLTVTLMPDGEGGGMAAIWATDFVASEVEDCFGNVIDQYSIYREATATEDGFAPAVGDLGLDFDCADFLSGEVPVRVYAIDNNGNADYCSVVVEVQLFQPDVCESSAGTIAGLITTEDMEGIENVQVALEGPEEANFNLTTAADGRLRFENVALGADYTITPTHFEDYLNGVRTSDIVAITRHILGVAELDNPYRLLAADVNGTEDIDVSDIIAIRRVILGLSDAFPNGMPSWSFVATSHEFDVPTNPWSTAFPEVINVNNLAGNVLDADFIGVKLGDVNGTAIPNSEATGRARNLQGYLDLEMEELDMQMGESYAVPVRAKDLTSVEGYQFTLEFDRAAVEIESITPGLVGAGNFGMRFASAGLITTSWNWAGSSVPNTWTGDEILFTLEVTALTDGKLSDALTAGSRYTEAEAYVRGSNEVRDIALIFNGAVEVTGGYQLLQNIPNPVSRETMIGFELPVAEAEVIITITDAAGRLVREYRQEGIAGYNSLRVTKQELGGASGVYSYTVAAGDWVATKRMVIME